MSNFLESTPPPQKALTFEQVLEGHYKNLIDYDSDFDLYKDKKYYGFNTIRGSNPFQKSVQNKIPTYKELNESQLVTLIDIESTSEPAFKFFNKKLGYEDTNPNELVINSELDVKDFREQLPETFYSIILLGSDERNPTQEQKHPVFKLFFTLPKNYMEGGYENHLVPDVLEDTPDYLWIESTKQIGKEISVVDYECESIQNLDSGTFTLEFQKPSSQEQPINIIPVNVYDVNPGTVYKFSITLKQKGNDRTFNIPVQVRT